MFNQIFADGSISTISDELAIFENKRTEADTEHEKEILAFQLSPRMEKEC